MQFERHFRAIRDECGLTQADVCEVIGKSEGFLSKLETGKTLPKFRTLLQLARLYNRHPLDFFTFRNVPPPRLREWRCATCGAGVEVPGAQP